MKAIIMAGGEGTRLRPLTCSVPKPLSLLCGRPVVHYILDLLDSHGFDEAVFTLGYKAEQIEQLFETGRYKNIKLGFSREDTPLGTAGCVKKAVGGDSDGKEDFLVISGDALCDFDLSAVLEYHKKSKAQATIITKRVNDPREYGLVISENGRITGFSEKPSYLGCTCDCANTGVYVLSSSVMELIPDNTPYDFARDVFPKMLKTPDSLFSFEETGYWCDIGDFSTYAKSQLDILSGRVKCHIEGEKISDGVYSRSTIPSHVTIESPCYIGENVTFSKGGNGIKDNKACCGNILISSSVIGNNVNIGNNTKIKGSIIMDSAYISDGVTANQAIICPNAKLMHASSVYEGGVIGEGCLIGREAIISGGVKIWNEKSIPPGANITRDIKYGSRTVIELSETGGSSTSITGETNADITPELCSRLGAALSTVTGFSKIVGISCEDNNASKAIKLAVISGAASSGSEVFDFGAVSLPQLLYAAETLNCGVICRIKCGIFTQIDIFGGNGLPLSRQEERRLEAALTRSEYKNADSNNFGEIHAMSGFDKMYTSMLYNHARLKSGYRIKLNCNNAKMSQSLEPVFEAISSKTGKALVVTLTDGGSRVEFYTEDDVKIGYEQLLLLAAAGKMSKGFDVAVPNDFAACAEFLAASYGRTVYRYFLCPNDASDKHARGLAAQQLFLRDGAVLALSVLEYLAENEMTIENAVRAIPHFACERREVEINCPPQRIISRLCEDDSMLCGRGEGILVGNNRENVLIRSSKGGRSLFLMAESLSSETASQLCDDAEGLIKNLIKDMVD